MRKIRRLAAWTAVLAFGLFLSVTAVVEPVFATDGDGDGLSLDFESAIGTSDSDVDSDDDSWSDFDEVTLHGTDPTLPDSDGDTQDDSFDPDPLDDGDSEGGETTPSLAYDSNLAHAAPVGTTPFEGRSINAMTGEAEVVLVRVGFGAGRMGQNVLELRYYAASRIMPRGALRLPVLSPPCSPAAGPRSTIQSAVRMVSSSCSTTSTVLPRSRNPFSVSSRRVLSRGCRPMEGSSST